MKLLISFVSILTLQVSGLWKYHDRLGRLVSFHSGQVRNLLFTCPGTSIMKVNTSLYFNSIIMMNSHDSVEEAS